MSDTEKPQVRPTLGPWLQHQLSSLLTRQGHAWLLQGPSGLGQYSLGLELARTWLCEQPTPQGACYQCKSCHAVDVRTHADLAVLMPETLALELGWPLDEKTQKDLDDKKRKPSKEIRVEAARDMVAFTQQTRSGGSTKVVLIYPAERMNHVTANTILKTLEEPPGETRFVLASEAAHQLLPTIRSRCQMHNMAWPDEPQSLQWLSEQGLPAADAPSLLRAAGGRPEDALMLANTGLKASQWAALPKAAQRGDLSSLSDSTPAQIISALQKLCHDLLASHAGAAPRFFLPADLPMAGSMASLTQWAKDLSQSLRTAEHPYNPGLMVEALAAGAQMAMRHSADKAQRTSAPRA
jgi:DNA polymerase-3 subunit delta'